EDDENDVESDLPVVGDEPPQRHRKSGRQFHASILATLGWRGQISPPLGTFRVGRSTESTPPFRSASLVATCAPPARPLLLDDRRQPRRQLAHADKVGVNEVIKVFGFEEVT